MAATRLQPAENLSKRRPLANIFNLYILLSVIGQFAVHVIAMREVTALAKAFMPEYAQPVRVRAPLARRTHGRVDAAPLAG